MRKVKQVLVCFFLICSIFSTGCDASKIGEIIQKVADGIQQAIPAIQQIVQTVTQTVQSIKSTLDNSDPNRTSQNSTNVTPSPTETNTSGSDATVQITTPGDSEGLPDTSANNVSGTTTTTNTNIPSSSGQESGTSFMERTANMSRAQKDQAIVQAITSGNMPGFLRNFKDVTVNRRLSDGRTHTITYKVMPDYLAIGSDSDFVRTPMTPDAAQQIADQFGCILPTTQMVDDIYSSSQTKLSPRPMSGGAYPNWESRMTQNEFFNEHQRLLNAQTQQAGHTNGNLVAGHKKDIVITNRLNSNPGKVAIYGWHQTNGRPIQNLTTVHSKDYADYSHGVRLIQKKVIVDGREMDIEDVLRDPILSGLLSNEGPINNSSAVR